MLEELYKTESLDRENSRRDYLFYLALGSARLKVCQYDVFCEPHLDSDNLKTLK